MLLEGTKVPEYVQNETLQRYLSDTSSSIDAMLDTVSGFPNDFLTHNLDGSTSSLSRTSLTNIGLAIPCILAQQELELKSFELAEFELEKIIKSLELMQSTDICVDGLFLNWVGTCTEKPVPYVGFNAHFSSVDTAWLATGLEAGEYGFPLLKDRFKTLRNAIKFNRFHNPKENLMYGELRYPDGEPKAWMYRVATEARQAAYVGVQYGLPETLLESMIFNGKTWNGSVFERTMPLMFIDEPEALHRDYLKAVMDDTTFSDGIWGKSPCIGPQGYWEFGNKKLALNPDIVDTSIITPYASFQVLPFYPKAAQYNLEKMIDKFPEVYIKGYGFGDCVDTKTGEVVTTQLFVDQAMSFLPVFNYLTGNRLHNWTPELNAVARRIHSN